MTVDVYKRQPYVKIQKGARSINLQEGLGKSYATGAMDWWDGMTIDRAPSSRGLHRRNAGGHLTTSSRGPQGCQSAPGMKPKS